MIWRIRFEIGGGHVHCRLFCAPGPDRTFAKCGEFTVCKGEEFASLLHVFDAEFLSNDPESTIAEASKP